MKQTFLIILSIIFYISCTPHYSVYTECSQSNTDKALNAWQSVEDFEYYFSVRENTAKIKIRKWNNIMILGAYYGDGNIDSIDNWRTIAHEIGHFFEYTHSDDVYSIMYPVQILTATNFIGLTKK